MRSFEELEAKLKEIQQHYENLAVGLGGGPVGSIASFTLDQPLNGQSTLQAYCLTPCPYGTTQLLKDVNGSWYAVSSSAAVLQNIEVAQNRRRTVEDPTQPVRIAMLIRVTSDQAVPNEFGDPERLDTYWAMVNGRPFEVISQSHAEFRNFGDVQVYYTALRSPFLSADASGRITVDTWKYEGEIYDEGGYLAERINRRINYHFRLQGAVVQPLDSSPSWRGSWVNSTDLYDTSITDTATPDPNPCLDSYRKSPTQNVYSGNVWRLPVFFPPSDAPNQLLGSGVTLTTEEMEYLISHSIDGRVTIVPIRTDGVTCFSDGQAGENREFKTARLRWEIPNLPNVVARVVSLIAY